MPITVELQDMFFYSNWILFISILLCIILIAIGVFVLIYARKKKKRETPGSVMKEKPKSVKHIVPADEVKQKYNKLIDELEKCHRNEKISTRKAYQELSIVLRKFVNELTGVKVHNYTLTEIKKIDMAQLADVIEECYSPEFSADSVGDLYDTMKKARNVIQKWK